MKNILCALFNHRYPPRPRRGLSLLDDYDWYRCSRCGEPYYRDEDFTIFGGKEKFFAENRKPKQLPRY